MLYRAGAELVVLIHGLFVLFVVLGSLLALRWPRIAWIHVPAAAWGAVIEFADWSCPLTPLEQWLRRLGGERGYSEGFLEHHVASLVYPAGLTRTTQIALGLGVVIVNLLVYGWAVRRRSS
jgi:hypothetical protein